MAIPEWPDLSAHNKAWLLAKSELGSTATDSELLQRAAHIQRNIEAKQAAKKLRAQPRGIWVTFGPLVLVAALLIFLALSANALAQVPEAPQPQAKPVHVYTFRKSWEDPPLRTNRQVFKSPIFWISEGIAIASMSVACSRKGTGEHWDAEAPAIGVGFGLSYLSERFFSELFTVGIGAYQTQHYIRSSPTQPLIGAKTRCLNSPTYRCN